MKRSSRGSTRTLYDEHVCRNPSRCMGTVSSLPGNTLRKIARASFVPVNEDSLLSSFL
jgi:hypothetical protein